MDWKMKDIYILNFSFMHLFINIWQFLISQTLTRLTYLSQDLSIKAKNETLNCTQGLRNGLIKKYWKGFPFHLWWFRSWQFSQAKKYSPLFSSMFKSKLDLATGKKLCKIWQVQWNISEGACRCRAGPCSLWLTHMVLIWTTIVLSGSGIINAFSPRPGIHSTSKSSLPFLYLGHQGIKFGWGETTWGIFQLSFNPCFSLYTSLGLYPTHLIVSTAFHLKWQPVSISCIQPTTRHGDNSFLYMLLPVWPLNEFCNKSLVITGHRNSCLLESQSYVTGYVFLKLPFFFVFS